VTSEPTAEEERAAFESTLQDFSFAHRRVTNTLNIAHFEGEGSHEPMAAKIRAKGSNVVHCARGLPAEMLAAFAELLRDYELRHTTPNPTIDEMLAMGEAMRRRVNRHEQGASQFAAFGKTAKAFVLHVRIRLCV
jgi:hypothetical protein